jgi:hypothetical protein
VSKRKLSTRGSAPTPERKDANNRPNWTLWVQVIIREAVDFLLW